VILIDTIVLLTYYATIFTLKMIVPASTE